VPFQKEKTYCWVLLRKGRCTRPLLKRYEKTAVKFMRCWGGRLSRPVGQRLAEVPLDPRLGRALLAAGELGCSEELATIAAMLSVQSVWTGPRGERHALMAAKDKCVAFLHAILPVLLAWKSSCSRAAMSGSQHTPLLAPLMRTWSQSAIMAWFTWQC
jgi:hypothetical protein